MGVRPLSTLFDLIFYHIYRIPFLFHTYSREDGMPD